MGGGAVLLSSGAAARAGEVRLAERAECVTRVEVVPWVVPIPRRRSSRPVDSPPAGVLDFLAVKLAPPPDPAFESRLPRRLRRALDDYVALERRVQAIASGTCAGTCAACRAPCCRAIYCAESWDAPWLRAATSREGAVRAVTPADAVEGHLARDGCRLRFGRPPVCYEFACADVLGTIRGDDAKYIFHVISHIMTFAGENALPRTHLVEVQDLSALDAARTARLRRRIALAGRIFEAAARLFAAVRAGAPGAPADWDLLTAHFSSRGFRLSRDAAARPARASARSAPGGITLMKTLPIVRAALAGVLVVSAGLAGIACGAPPRRLALADPKPVAADIYRDDEFQARFIATDRALEVELHNRGSEPIAIPWDKARFVDPQGSEHEVVAYQGELTKEMLDAPQEPLVLKPRSSWRGLVHPRDRVRPQGVRALPLALLDSGEVAAGKTCRLDLEVNFANRPHRYEFKLLVTDVPAEGKS